MDSGTCTHAVRVIHVDLNDAQGEKSEPEPQDMAPSIGIHRE
jgi:hypothetical protein